MTRAFLKRWPMLQWCIEYIGHARYPLYGTQKQDVLIDCFIQWWHVSKCYLVTTKLHKFSNRLFNSYKWLQKFLALWKCHTMPHKNVQNCQNIDEATINSLQTAAHISFCLHPLIPLLPVTSSTSVCVLSLGWQNFGKVGVCVGGCRGSRAWEERGLDLIRAD